MRRLYIGLLSLFGCVLLALYQNVGRLSQIEKSKSLQMPHYFVSIYNEEKAKTPKSPSDYEGLLYDTPLYKRLLQEITIRGGSKGCDPSDPNVICPPSDQIGGPNDEKTRVSLSFDPAKNSANINVNDDWRSRIRYNSSINGAQFEIRKMLSKSSEVNFQCDQTASNSKISFEFNY